MILGMMQPYFFPYLGYWQLMDMADEYIIYDDVNFIKQGWIHRNRIKINGEAQYIKIGLNKASQNRKINEHFLKMDDKAKDLLIQKLQGAYGKAPYCAQVLELVREILDRGGDNLAEFLAYCNRATARYMGIETPIYTMTELGYELDTRGEDRVIEICKLRGADEYINAIGGTELYDKDTFAEEGIKLGFIRMDEGIEYPQGKGDFIPGLSILDVLMYNSQEEIRALLKRYTIE